MHYAHFYGRDAVLSFCGQESNKDHQMKTFDLDVILIYKIVRGK